jgi:serine/threonine-protein kinase HipA
MFAVYLHDVPIGTIAPRGRGLTFQYEARVVEDQSIPALSLSLPKQYERFPDSRAGRFFRNLLPEQAYRRLIAAGVGTAPENSLALLGAIGGECPGAVSIWPEGKAPPAEAQYERLETPQLRRLFSRADSHRLAEAVTRGRLSLAGTQEKIALLRDAVGDWLLPLNGAVTSHILKEAAPAFPNLLENELFCMALAQEAGLLVPDTGLASSEVRVFCAERFDRPPTAEGQRVKRAKIHQEDFCQALAVEPDNKYEGDGGPGLRQCAGVILQYSSLPADDLLRLLRWIGFNYLIGNEDAHAKNLALLYSTEGLRLTPHYDLVSTEVYRGLERRLAMKIGGAWDIRNVQGRDWRRLAAALGIPWDRFRPALLELADRVDGLVPRMMEVCSARFGPSPVYHEIRQVIERTVSQASLALGGR